MPGNLIWKGEGTETCERRALLPIPGLREFIIIIMTIIISTATIIIIILIGWFWSNMNCVKNLIVSHVKEATVPNLFWCQSLTWKKWSPTKFSSHRREMCWLLHLKISTSGGANYSSALLQKPDKKDLLVKNKLFSHKALCDSSENIWDPSRIYWAQVTPRLDRFPASLEKCKWVGETDYSSTIPTKFPRLIEVSSTKNHWTFFALHTKFRKAKIFLRWLSDQRPCNKKLSTKVYL